jgi:hypothetical protein
MRYVTLVVGLTVLVLANATALASYDTQQIAPQGNSIRVAPQQLAQVTMEPELQQALVYLAQGPGLGALRRIMTMPIKLVFKNMASFGPAYAHYDALAWMSQQGQLFIFVNQHHRGAPSAALAALLAHEAMHVDAFNSLQEETDGWRQEALTWAYWQHQQPALQTPTLQEGYPLVKRLNTLKQAHLQGSLDTLVRHNSGYSHLNEQSQAGLAHRYE